MEGFVIIMRYNLLILSLMSSNGLVAGWHPSVGELEWLGMVEGAVVRLNEVHLLRMFATRVLLVRLNEVVIMVLLVMVCAHSRE